MSPFSNEIEYVLILAQTLNISRAAELCGIKQSGLSKALMKVEERLEVKLFSRSKSGLQLTHEGLRVIKLLSDLKSNWDTAWRASNRDDFIGTVKIGCHTSIAQSSFSNFFSDLVENHPGVNMDMTFDRSLAITRKVINSEIDLGLVISPQRHPELVISLLRRETVGVWKSQKAKKSINLVYFNPEMIDIYSYLRAFTGYKLVPISDYITISAILRESQGCGILPSCTAAMMGDLKLEKELKATQLNLIYRKDRSYNRTLQAVIRIIKDGFRP